MAELFYHIKNLQSTKTATDAEPEELGFITLRIYKVLKPPILPAFLLFVLSH